MKVGEIEWQLAIGGDGDDVTRELTRPVMVEPLADNPHPVFPETKPFPIRVDMIFYLVKLGCNNGLYRDLDGDGYGDLSNQWSVVNGHTGWHTTILTVMIRTICQSIGMIEVANGIDDNCNGIIDDLPSALS